MTVAEIARGLAFLDRRAVANDEDWRLARLAQPRIAAVTDQELAAAWPVADEFLAQEFPELFWAGPGGGGRG